MNIFLHLSQNKSIIYTVCRFIAMVLLTGDITGRFIFVNAKKLLILLLQIRQAGK